MIPHTLRDSRIRGFTAVRPKMPPADRRAGAHTGKASRPRRGFPAAELQPQGTRGEPLDGIGIKIGGLARWQIHDGSASVIVTR